jgi:DNA replication regulator SLD2
MSELTFNEKYHLLKLYAHHLKKQLKTHSGTVVRKGSSIENKLHVYKKIRKVVHYCDELSIASDDKKAVNQVNEYYKYLEKKIQRLKFSINEKKIEKEEKKIESSTLPVKQGKLTEESLHETLDKVISDHNDDDDDYGDEDDDELNEITEIGPTPQLNGRVLTIFDIQTSPEKFNISPLKNRQNQQQKDLNLGINLDSLDIPDDAVFKTPSKLTSMQSLSYSSLETSSRKLNFETTPKVSKLNEIGETPRYLRTQTIKLNNVDEIIIGDEWSDDDDDADVDASDDESLPNIISSDNEEGNILEELNELESHINIEPSPIIKRTGKSLFELHEDLVIFKKKLTGLELLKENTVNEYEEANDLTNVEDLELEKNIEKNLNDETSKNDEDEITKVFDPHYKLRNKIKTIKRSTRRAKLRTEKLCIEDDLDEIDIHALAFGKHKLDFDVDHNQSDDNNEAENDDTNNNKDNSNAVDENDEYDYGEEDEIYERKGVEQLEKELQVGKIKGKGRHPLSNNFVRLKINRGGKGRFKRRR